MEKAAAARAFESVSFFREKARAFESVSFFREKVGAGKTNFVLGFSSNYLLPTLLESLGKKSNTLLSTF